MKHFDLNIDTILENWEVKHAIRELIANAIDESILTDTDFPEIQKDQSGWWRVRDYGRGLRYHDLIQTENPEKLDHPLVIGKFGVGLKDALATFDRKQVAVIIRSRYGDISLTRTGKHAFDDLVTLHAAVESASVPDMIGTECWIHGVRDADIEAAKAMFLRFGGAVLIENTRFGCVYPRSASGGIIYVNGMRVAEEANFLFSYDITSLNASLRRALNRERQNLGRIAYADRVRSILLECKSAEVTNALAKDMEVLVDGRAHDELTWIDVQQHAVRFLHASKRVVFMSSNQLILRPDVVDAAHGCGRQIVAIPEGLSQKIAGSTDASGRPVTEIHQFIRAQTESFEFKWIDPVSLTPAERAVWDQLDRILGFVGGRPDVVKDIRISESMRAAPTPMDSTVGLWDGANGWIVVKRVVLRDISSFAGTVLHEVLHAKYDLGDVSRDFESHLTKLAGDLAALVLVGPQHSITGVGE